MRLIQPLTMVLYIGVEGEGKWTRLNYMYIESWHLTA